MGIVLGLISAFCFGSADFLARFSARSVGAHSTQFLMQFIGFTGLGLWLIATGELLHHVQARSLEDWLWAVAANVISIGAVMALYRSFQFGMISVVSPIAASFAAVTVLMSVAGGEHLSLVRALGILLMIPGVMLASRSPNPVSPVATVPKRGLPPGVGWALAASLTFGISYWMTGFKVIPAFGVVASSWLTRLLTIVVLGLLSLLTGMRVERPRGHTWGFLIGLGVLDTLALLTMAGAMASEQVAVATVLTSLFSVVTVIEAWIILRERLARAQWLGIVLIFAGIVLVSL